MKPPLFQKSPNSVVSFLTGIVMILMGTLQAEGKGLQAFRENVKKPYGYDQTHGGFTKATRQDPFQRVQKRMPETVPSRTISQEPVTVPDFTDPGWKLLAVIHGGDGYQAVLQLSSTRRVIVQRGTVIANSDWYVKTIGEQGVLLEHSSASREKSARSPSKHILLSFPLPPESSSRDAE